MLREISEKAPVFLSVENENKPAWVNKNRVRVSDVAMQKLIIDGLKDKHLRVRIEHKAGDPFMTIISENPSKEK